MHRFTQLYIELDRTTDVAEKLGSLKRYFTEAPPEDAAWALFFLSGQRLARSAKTADLRQWVAEECLLPLWLVEESYDKVGDLSETLALLVASSASSLHIPLHVVVQERVLPLKQLPDEGRHALITQTWRELTTEECLVYHKLLMGEFHGKVSRAHIVHALAEIAGVHPTDIAYRVMRPWKPIAKDFTNILHSSSSNVFRPYPFCTTYPLDSQPQELGDIDEWQAEWKWDGIRVQLIKRDDQVLLWSREEELITDRFPEIAESARHFPNGTVFDGEVLAWQVERPMPFAELERRVTRRSIDKKIRTEVPVMLMIYDILEIRGEDIRGKSLEHRRRLLERLLDAINEPLPFILSPIIDASNWDDLKHAHSSSRERLVEGIMLKRRSSAYSDDRRQREWLKWKVDPFIVNVVLMYAQQGSAKEKSLFTDYTFGVWSDPDENGERTLVPIAKANSGLTDHDREMIDQFVRQNTVDKFGPVRVVRPELVFELAFEGIQRSTRHKAGLTLRSPRLLRWWQDALVEAAHSLAGIQNLLKGTE